MVGVSLIGLFLPAILRFEYGLSLSQIFLYESAYSIVAVVLMYTSGLRLIARHGTVTSMLVGISLFILNFIVLYVSKTIPALLFLSPILAGCYVAYFRTWFHISLAMGAGKDTHFGSTYSLIEIVGVVAGIIGPLIGGVLADQFGTTSLYIMTIICLLLSCIPFFMDKNRTHHAFVYQPSQIRQRVKQHKWFLRMVVGSFSGLSYVGFVASVVRSIILFGQLWSYSKVWLINFFSSGILFFLLRIIWKQIDANKQTILSKLRRVYLSLRGQGGVWLVAGLSMLMWFFWQGIFLLVDTLNKITNKVNETYIMATFYTIADHKKNMTVLLDTIFVREFAIHVTRIVFCWILALFTFLVNDTQRWLILPLFLVIAFTPLSMMLLKKRARHQAV